MTSQARSARIVLVTAQTTGGIGRHVSSLLPELLNRGARVEVAAPRATGGLGTEATGTPFWPVEIPRLPSPMPAVSALRELKRALDGADLVHAHHEFVALVPQGPLHRELRHLLVRHPLGRQLLARRGNHRLRP